MIFMLLLLLNPLAGATPFFTSNLQPEFIVFNASIYSMSTSEYSRPGRAMAVLADRILEIGEEAFLFTKYPTFQRLDAQGLTIIPGFVDGHGHLSGEGNLILNVDLTNVQSESEAINRIQKYIEEHDIPRGEWVTGGGWDHLFFPDNQWPTNASLDSAFPYNPMYFTRHDFHALWANSFAMELAGIPDNVYGGFIFRDVSGLPTGIFIDNAMGLLFRLAPPSGQRERVKQSIQISVNILSSLGITGLANPIMSEQEVDVVKELIDEDDFNIRVFGYFHIVDRLGHTDVELLEKYCTGMSPELPPVNYGNGKLSVVGTKLHFDGEIGSQGAALFENYVNESHNGLTRMEAEDYFELASQWAKCGYQISTHAVGDRAIHEILDIYERMFINDPDLQLERFRIEHVEMPLREDISRFSTLKVLPLMQPTHFPYKSRYATEILGPERASRAFPLKSWFDIGIETPLGSDFSVVQPSTFLGIYSAISYQHPDGTPPGGYRPEERISVWQAVRGFTYNSAYASHQEMQVGSLETGKYADFIILDNNIIEEGDQNFELVLNTNVVATFIGGKLVFAADI